MRDGGILSRGSFRIASYSGPSTLHAPSGKSGEDFLIGGESTAISGMCPCLHGPTKTRFLDYIIPSGILRQGICQLV